MDDLDPVAWARGLARQLLAEPLPGRWAHTQSVGRKAESIAHLAGDDGETLICAAWLHDIGYSPDLAVTGFHPLDGARYLRDSCNADKRLCELVAHHSYAVIEAGNRGLQEELLNEFARPDGFVSDALVYCDMTTGPTGQSLDAESRLNEILHRYGPDHVVTKSINDAAPQILASVHTVTTALESHPR